MKCQGNFKFKSLEKREGGKFVNGKGEEISYKESYSLKLDEITEDGKIYERTFKVLTDSELVEPLLITKPYSDITLEFDVKIYGSKISCIPVAIVK